MLLEKKSTAIEIVNPAHGGVFDCSGERLPQLPQSSDTRHIDDLGSASEAADGTKGE